MTRFNQQVAVITGGAEGIGKALATQLVAQGAHVIIADIDEEKAQSVTATLAARHSAGSGSVNYRILNVADEQAVVSLIDDVAQEYGGLDYVFNNAGIAVTGDARDISFKQWNRVTEVNQSGVIHGSMAAYRIMSRQGKGHIVNIASLAGLIPFPTNLPYSATKSAVVGLSLSLRAEAKDLGVKVSVVCPGFIQSNIFEASEIINAPRDKVMSNIAFKLVETNVAATKILTGVEKNKAIIVFPTYAKILWWLYRLHPALMEPLAHKLIRDLRKIRKTATED